MSLTWSSYSTPDTTGDIQTAEVSITAEYDFSQQYEDNVTIACTVDFSCPPEVSQQEMLDMLTPLHDALVTAGWANVTVSQKAVVIRTAS